MGAGAETTSGNAVQAGPLRVARGMIGRYNTLQDHGPSVSMACLGAMDVSTYGVRDRCGRRDDPRAPSHLLGLSVWRGRRAACGGSQVLPLQPRGPGDVGYLVAHPGRLVTKAEVLQHVWGHPCRRRPAGLGARDSGGVGRRGEAAVSRNRGRAGLSVSGRRRSGGAPPRTTSPWWGRQGNLAAAEGMVPAGGARHPSARLRQWGSGGGEDDGGRDVPEPPGRRARAVDGAGPRCVEHSGRKRTCPSWKRWGAWGAKPTVLAVLRRYAPVAGAQLPGW